MTWKVFATALLAAVALATGCALPGSSAPAAAVKASSSPVVAAHCADLVAKAMTSAAVVVTGSYACLNAREQRAAAGAGVTSDASFEDFAASQGFVHENFLAATSDSGYVFEYLTSSLSLTVVTIWLDKYGLVTYILFGSNGS